MSLLRAALAQHSRALCERSAEGIHMRSIQKVSVLLHGLKPAAKQHSAGNTHRWSTSIYSTTSPTALSASLINIVVEALAYG